MIEVNEDFSVPAAVHEVWRLLADPYTVVGCVPGAAITSVGEDGSLDTTLSVKFGPLSVAFQALATLELNEVAHEGRVSARGRDKQGGARFQASATFSVTPVSEGSLVTTRGEVDLKGPLASMIETGAGAVVKRMSADFAACLRARCAAV
jgi:carbon monoxide dehydrogenase subunit G